MVKSPFSGGYVSGFFGQENAKHEAVGKCHNKKMNNRLKKCTCKPKECKSNAKIYKSSVKKCKCNAKECKCNTKEYQSNVKECLVCEVIVIVSPEKRKIPTKNGRVPCTF
jgi:hypothetical protein